MKQFLTRLLCIIFLSAFNLLSQPFWNAGEGPYGGTILDFAFNSQGHIYGAGYNGLFRSINNGQDWESVSPQTFSNLFQVYTVAIDQMDNIYAGTYTGIFKSTDNGVTFNPSNNGLLDLNINAIEISPSGVIFTGSFSGVSRSTDSGNNWTVVNSGLPGNAGVQDFVIDSSTEEIFAGTTQGVFSSTDNGDNWNDLNTGLPANAVITDLDLSPPGSRGGKYLFAGTDQGAYRYDRLLQTWLHLATGLGIAYIYALAVNLQGDIFVGTGTGIYRHLAAASQWTQLNVALIFSYVTALAITPLGYLIAAEDWGGPLLSMDNGNTWLRIISGLTAYGIASLYYSHLLGKFFIGTDAGYFKGLAALTGWLLIYPETFPFFFVAATVYSPLGFLFAATAFQGIWRSTNEGLTWQQVNNGLNNLFITALVVNALGHLFASTQGGGVFFSDDSGDNWIALNTGLTVLFVTALYFSQFGDLYAGTANGGVFKYNFSLSSWTQLTLAGLTSFYITAILVNSLGDIYAGTGTGLFQLASGAASWVALGFAVTIINDLIQRNLARSSVDEIFAATPAGVFSSTDGGINWNPLNTGLEGNLNVFKFAADSSGGIYAAVNGGGMFSNGEPNIIKLTDGNSPDNYILHQNYPNPFNPSTTIQFALPNESFTKIEIFNSLGEKVSTLVSENLSAGTYKYEWNAEGLPGGVYFYRISTENFKQTKKLMLLK
ncbi:MAG: T9SS C-terminal target domain-containing protein [Ignavibacteriales bacterium]|nr:MAG: T9SS C-terminal target domain-containing protein [Ignavibacteriales bacterium]